jgi:hypothetical protein
MARDFALDATLLGHHRADQHERGFRVFAIERIRHDAEDLSCAPLGSPSSGAVGGLNETHKPPEEPSTSEGEGGPVRAEPSLAFGALAGALAINGDGPCQPWSRSAPVFG